MMKKIPKVQYLSSCTLLLWCLPHFSIASQTAMDTKVVISHDPVLKTTSVPGNVALALSVEFPTALVNAHKDGYDPATEYLGYFDPMKCYKYIKLSPDEKSYFSPVIKKESLSDTCSNSTEGKWNGNFLNWAITSTIDPFRWVMTGGNRSVDTEDQTLLLKSYDNGKSFNSTEKRYFPDRSVTASVFKSNTGLESKANATDTTSTNRYIVLYKEGNFANFIIGTNKNGKADRYHIQVEVCVKGLLESNCKEYTSKSGKKIWKPEGLIQNYSRDLRFSAFGYLNDDSESRDAGVMRAPMAFVGPYDEFQANRENLNKEWSEETGIFFTNPYKNTTEKNSPDTDYAEKTNNYYNLKSPSLVQNSGLINYINKFGQFTKEYKFNDPVSELYYAITRYYRGLGPINSWHELSSDDSLIRNLKSVTDYSNSLTYDFLNSKAKELWLAENPGGNWDKASNQTSWRNKAKDFYTNAYIESNRENFEQQISQLKLNTLDHFPIITEWDDPVKFSCQKNSILGIGDIFTNKDTNIPPSLGTATYSDNDLKSYTKTVTGIPTSHTNISSFLIADLANFANNFDLRKNKKADEKKQTIQTYWVDVLEDSVSFKNNQYYLAAKYGDSGNWESGDSINVYSSYEHSNGKWNNKGSAESVIRPRNYFQAGNPKSMKNGLEEAFKKMSWEAKNLSTTAFSFTNNDLSFANTYYSVSYDSQYWSANIKAHSIDANGKIITDAAGKPTVTWETSKKIQSNHEDRMILTWKWGENGSPDSGVIFEHDKLSTDQKKALDTSYVKDDDSLEFSKWLRGNSTNSNYRSRLGAPDASGVRRFNPLGDVINSKLVASSAPSLALSSAAHPGYISFKESHAERETILFVGANDGMLHAIRTDDKPNSNGEQAGKELFAYMPSSFFLPEAGSPVDATEGVITKLGQHYYNHRSYVDATVVVGDVDFKRSGIENHKSIPNTEHEWHTILVGGLGAGGYQYYALDVTDPESFLNSDTAASNLLWEFPHRNQLPQSLGGKCPTTSNGCINIGMTFGTPNIIKTEKYGWVVAVTSGFNNEPINGVRKGNLYLLNPKNGQLLETHTTTEPSNGLAHSTAFMPNYSSMVSDAIYAGDINGQLWRFDLTGNAKSLSEANKIYEAKLLAILTDSSADKKPQPITTRPIVQVHPKNRKRYVLIGTGRLLDSIDLQDTQEQSFYAIVDGNTGAFSKHEVPLKRSDLGTGGPSVTVKRPTEHGWVMDLGIGSANDSTLSWRNIFSATVSGGYVSFSSILPVANYCEGTGSSRIYSMDFMQGESILLGDNDELLKYLDVNFIAFDIPTIRFDGKVQLWIGGGDSDIKIQDNLNIKGDKKGQLSWREIPVAQ